MKRGLLLLTTVLIIVFASLVLSQETVSEDSKVNNARSCLEDKVGDCSSLSAEEKIFSLLSIGKCKEELVADSENVDCWPKGNCNIKTTSQATLALHKTGNLVENSKNWLFSKEITTTDINWYLQIDPAEAASCDISYDTFSYTINIGEDKKLSSGAGSCLIKTSDDYWLRVSSSCYEKEFSISCDKSFSTNLLYQKQGSSTIYVSETTQSSSPGGTLKEKVSSSCFSLDSICDYEGSLWATLVLDSLGEDVFPYLPYLMSRADEMISRRFLPESFLHTLTRDYRDELLSRQKTVNNYHYWEESGDRYYDTALALYPFQYDEPSEKTLSKEWLLSEDVQGNTGCWDNENIRNTAFILYSIWPTIMAVDVGGIDCQDSGYHCMSNINCNEMNGEVLDGYTCAGSLVCCDREYVLQTCLEQDGEVCRSDEICEGGREVPASGLSAGRTCCVGGSCEEAEIPTLNECEEAEGTCRAFDCRSDEREISESCDSVNEVCCIPRTERANYAWVVILSILIVLTVLGIIFREKLKDFFWKVKSKFGKKSKGGPAPSQGPGFPRGPPPSTPPLMRGSPRRVLPQSQRPARRPQPKSRVPGDVDDVLKKLKEMGGK